MNILLYLAEQVKVYFPPSEIPAMLDAFLPLVTQSVRAVPSFPGLYQKLTPPVRTHHDPRHDLFPPPIRRSPLRPCSF